MDEANIRLIDILHHLEANERCGTVANEEDIPRTEKVMFPPDEAPETGRHSETVDGALGLPQIVFDKEGGRKISTKKKTKDDSGDDVLSLPSEGNLEEEEV